MAKALSTDIRARVVAYVHAGHSRRAAANKLAISASSAVRFAAQLAQTGSLAPKSGPRGQRPKLDKHRGFLLARIKEEPDITMPALAEELAALGTQIDPSNISRWFIKNGFSFKKNTAGERTRQA